MHRTIKRFSVERNGVQSANLNISSIVFGSTPQQRLMAEKEAKKRALAISKYISMAEGAVKGKFFLVIAMIL